MNYDALAVFFGLLTFALVFYGILRYTREPVPVDLPKGYPPLPKAWPPPPPAPPPGPSSRFSPEPAVGTCAHGYRFDWCPWCGK